MAIFQSMPKPTLPNLTQPDLYLGVYLRDFKVDHVAISYPNYKENLKVLVQKLNKIDLGHYLIE